MKRPRLTEARRKACINACRNADLRWIRPRRVDYRLQSFGDCLDACLGKHVGDIRRVSVMCRPSDYLTGQNRGHRSFAAGEPFDAVPHLSHAPPLKKPPADDDPAIASARVQKG